MTWSLKQHDTTAPAVTNTGWDLGAGTKCKSRMIWGLDWLVVARQLKWKNSMSWTLDKAVMSGDKHLIVNKLEILSLCQWWLTRWTGFNWVWVCNDFSSTSVSISSVHVQCKLFHLKVAVKCKKILDDFCYHTTCNTESGNGGGCFFDEGNRKPQDLGTKVNMDFGEEKQTC